METRMQTSMIPFSVKLTDAEKTSAALLPEKGTLIAKILAEYGLVVIENALDTTFVYEAKVNHDKALDGYLRERGGMDALAGKTFGDKHIGFFPPLLGVLSNPKIVANPIAIQVLRQVMGDVRSSFVHTNTALPGSGYQPIHRDTPHLFGYNSIVTPMVHAVVNIPLCPFTLENGATEVWPKTHTLGDSSEADAECIDKRARLLPSVQTVLPVGSIIIRDLRLWHRGVPNPSQSIRTMVAVVYQRGFIHEDVCTIPQTTWDGWDPSTQQVFRFNRVVADSAHTTRSWY